MKHYRFVVLLGALTVLLVATPCLRYLGNTAQLVFALTFSGVLLSAVRVVEASPRTRLVAHVFAALAIALQFLFIFGSQKLQGASSAAGVLFLSYIVAIILRYLFSTQRITLDMIAASLCVYLLLGIIWASLYSIVGILEGEAAFKLPASSVADESGIRFSIFGLFEGEVAFNWPGPSVAAESGIRFGGDDSITAIYFSFVTLCTLGYGDVTPASSAARMLAVLEAIIGQLYLTVLVARLVGMHVSQSKDELESSKSA